MPLGDVTRSEGVETSIGTVAYSSDLRPVPPPPEGFVWVDVLQPLPRLKGRVRPTLASVPLPPPPAGEKGENLVSHPLSTPASPKGGRPPGPLTYPPVAPSPGVGAVFGLLPRLSCPGLTFVYPGGTVRALWPRLPLLLPLPPRLDRPAG